jgi:hypothetical protein
LHGITVRLMPDRITDRKPIVVRVPETVAAGDRVLLGDRREDVVDEREDGRVRSEADRIACRGAPSGRSAWMNAAASSTIATSASRNP